MPPGGKTWGDPWPRGQDLGVTCVGGGQNLDWSAGAGSKDGSGVPGVGSGPENRVGEGRKADCGGA